MAKKVVIVGGSLAGLMHGIMLKDHGYPVTILESDTAKERHSHAAGIGVGGEVIRFLQRFDKTGRPFSIPIKTIDFIGKDGKRKFSMKTALHFTSWKVLASIFRTNLDGQESKLEQASPQRDSEHNHIPPVYMSGKCVTGIHEVGRDVKVEFEDVTDGTRQSVDAQLVIAADGSNSFARRVFMPESKRRYAGLVAWRGNVQEDLLTEETRRVFDGKMTVQLMDRNYILVYAIPTDDGNAEPGKRLLNWVWYSNVAEDSEKLKDLMTDINGRLHLGSTVPGNLIRPEAWEKVKVIGVPAMAASFIELLEKTRAPFVSKVHEVVSNKASFLDGKLVLVGDALVTFRPHIALSTNQAAYHCRLLEEVLEGRMEMRGWNTAVTRYGHASSRLSKAVGTFGLANKFLFLRELFGYFFLVLAQKLNLV